MKGILLVNTGSPQSNKRGDVKAFVGAMLSDPKVLTVPDWFRPILVKGIILPLRQFSSTAHYNLIWDHENSTSPLLHNMQQLGEKLEKITGLPVEVGMRYLNPNITDAFDRLVEKNNQLDEVIVVPLFPHYAESSYQTTVNEVQRCFASKEYPFSLQVIEPYFNHPTYIKALVKSIKPYLADGFDKLIFNFHSLPLSHVESAWKKGVEFDYVYQVKETVKLVVAGLGVDKAKVRKTFSSAIGKKWLEPSLDKTLEDLAKAGRKSIVVVSPGFSVDNLETLFDIGIQARKIFLANGGERLEVVPCLNSEDYWVESLRTMIL